MTVESNGGSIWFHIQNITYIKCPPYENVINGMNDAWKIAMACERKRMPKSYKKEKNNGK